MADTPNPFVRGMLYNKERADKEFAELRGVSVEETKAEFDSMWGRLDALLHSNEGVLRPNQPSIAIRATSI